MIHIYTGNGKGKTTAALGLALRASGAGLKVYIGQFVKGKNYYSELKALKNLKNITVEQFGRGCFIRGNPAKLDIEMARKGLGRIKEIIGKRSYDVFILDEINIAVKLKLLSPKEVIGIMKIVSPRCELVLTGRYAHPDFLKLAHLVSEIREKKHYYRQGRKARKGIEY
jgi:cob(I)alamin adenosyltransferase